MYIKNYDDARFLRNVMFFEFGSYSEELLKIHPKQGFGPVLMTTMEPLPGVMVVDYTCATNPGQCDIGGNVSYHFNESLSKKGPCNDIIKYDLTDTFMPLKTCKTVD